MKVNEGTITSSPAPIPYAIRAAWSAEVPELNVTAWCTPRYDASPSSNSSTCGPIAQFMPEATASLTAARSWSSKYILNRGIFHMGLTGTGITNSSLRAGIKVKASTRNAVDGRGERICRGKQKVLKDILRSNRREK